jgi:hypothetical protein
MGDELMRQSTKAAIVLTAGFSLMALIYWGMNPLSADAEPLCSGMKPPWLSSKDSAPLGFRPTSAPFGDALIEVDRMSFDEIDPYHKQGFVVLRHHGVSRKVSSDPILDWRKEGPSIMLDCAQQLPFRIINTGTRQYTTGPKT